MNKIIIKKPTLATSILLQKFDVNLQRGLEDIMKYIFIQSNDAKYIRTLNQDEFENKVWDLMEQLNEEELYKLTNEIVEAYKEVSESEFITEPSDSEKKT